MANITEPRPDNRQEGVLLDATAGEDILAGALLTYSNGGVHNAVAAEPFAGIAMETAKSGTSVRYWKEGVVDLDCDAAVGVAANIGKQVTATDNHTVALATAAGGDGAATDAAAIVGQIVGINSTTSVRVKL